MRKRPMRILAAMIFGGAILLAAAQPARAQQPVQFQTADGVTIYANYYSAKSSSQPMILLFHQAGSNRYEYASIAPKLVAAGFSCLATDQRWGGSLFGHRNQTDEHMSKAARDAVSPDHDVQGLEVDLDAAVAWAHARDAHRRLILWGSSYSSSLVFPVAAAHPGEIAAVLAFSPAEYFGGHPTLIEDAARKIHVPVFITSENSAHATASATKIFDAVASSGKIHYVGKYAVHGSSTLLADRNPRGAVAAWAVVMRFLKPFEK